MNESKTAIITGAGKGIGKAIATGLAQLGYQTILVGRNKQNLEQVAQQIGSSAKVLQLDITDKPAVKEAIAKIVSENGSIDILVNNAGIYYDGTVDISDDDFEKMLETNLTAQFSLLKEVVPVMKAQKSGYIFNVASRAGKIGFAGSGAYSASKFGMVGLSESLYRELNPLGIKVTALCPGWVNTEMAFDAGTPLESEEMIQPNDLFKTIEWLLQLSPGACVQEVILESPNSIS
ncbi:SDR family oxidoreductase [Draconibacterium mangrovi]|uniref:SDR family oxidoreductase n=1 Tax=Draconibacterium mangrovi TaxID=2697469 RepID=UPI0013D39719|nr:SDR family oxidoreductase [Draconibacterium mangrovi]